MLWGVLGNAALGWGAVVLAPHALTLTLIGAKCERLCPWRAGQSPQIVDLRTPSENRPPPGGE